MGKPRAPAATEYRFTIDAYTPQTMPMARLSEYMAQLAEVLGEPAFVHFTKLESGSTVLVHKIEREASPKVRDRIAAVERGDAPRDAQRAFRHVNKLLREDNGVGLLQDKKGGATILRFPGREESEERFPSVRQQGTIDGFVMRVGGTDDTVPVLIKSEDQLISGCHTDKRTAKQLAQKLFEPVRLHGKGRWSRDVEGCWSLVEFVISSFEPLKDVPLSAALAEIRSIDFKWGKEAYDELEMIRHGPLRNH